MRTRSGTARRLFVAFAALVSIFAASSYAALAHLREIRAGLRQMKESEAGVRIALELASAVRDQYAHQAHTIILGNDSHLRFYAEASNRVRALTAEVRARTVDADEQVCVSDIERREPLETARL